MIFLVTLLQQLLLTMACMSLNVVTSMDLPDSQGDGTGTVKNNIMQKRFTAKPAT